MSPEKKVHHLAKTCSISAIGFFSKNAKLCSITPAVVSATYQGNVFKFFVLFFYECA